MRTKAIKCLGFTLIELLITVAIVGILLGIAIPSFVEIMKSNRLTSITNSLITSLSYARNEAVKKGGQVTMINKGDWSSGWDICMDADADNACDGANDKLLRTVEAIPTGYSISTNGDDYSAFTADGLLKGRRAATLTICEGSSSGTSRQVVINVLGRTKLDTGNGTC